MTIKEVEQTLGITKANIRFYEKEGLLSPTRNSGNNYREYTDEDVFLLKKIKLLRGLGISIAEIQSLISSPDLLTDILQHRLKTVEQEQLHLKETQEACQIILKENLDFYSLSETLVEEQSRRLKERISLILTEDLTEKTMSGKQLTDVIGTMLLLSLLLTVLTSNLIFHFGIPIHNIMLDLYPILAVAAALLIAMTAKPLVHLIMFLVLTVSQSLAIVCFLRNQGGGLLPQIFDATHTMYLITLFIAIACVYTILIWILARFVPIYLKHWVCAFIPVVLFVFAAVIIYLPFMNSVVYPTIFFILFALYIPLRWHSLNKGVELCNRYYAITSAMQLINIVAFIFSARGAADSWRRGEKEYK